MSLLVELYAALNVSALMASSASGGWLMPKLSHVSLLHTSVSELPASKSTIPVSDSVQEHLCPWRYHNTLILMIREGVEPVRSGSAAVMGWKHLCESWGWWNKGDLGQSIDNTMRWLREIEEALWSKFVLIWRLNLAQKASEKIVGYESGAKSRLRALQTIHNHCTHQDPLGSKFQNQY